jgi:hypothetical protein
VILSCACSGNGGSGAVHYGIGKLAMRPACSRDAVGVWFAEDQPEGLQISTCSNVSGAYRWVVPGTPGASGALVVAEGTLDISNTIVPRINAANGFTGQNSFGGVQLTPKRYADLPLCSSATEGLHRWITDANTATWGATAAAGGAQHVGVVCNGTNWTVYAK